MQVLGVVVTMMACIRMLLVDVLVVIAIALQIIVTLMHLKVVPILISDVEILLITLYHFCRAPKRTKLLALLILL